MTGMTRVPMPKLNADPNDIEGIGAIVFTPQANKGTSVAQANLAPGNTSLPTWGRQGSRP
jgi:hypothetical protein